MASRFGLAAFRSFVVRGCTSVNLVTLKFSFMFGSTNLFSNSSSSFAVPLCWIFFALVEADVDADFAEALRGLSEAVEVGSLDLLGIREAIFDLFGLRCAFSSAFIRLGLMLGLMLVLMLGLGLGLRFSSFLTFFGCDLGSEFDALNCNSEALSSQSDALD